MPKKQGYCLVSQQIRGFIKTSKIITSLSSETNSNGYFKDLTLEARVQPSSFEPTLGKRIFILDSEQLSAFLPHPDETVELALSKIPKRQRPETELTPDFEIKQGYTYLIPLTEQFMLEKGDFIKSSPKSSIGRLFPVVRLVTDYNNFFNRVDSKNKKDTLLNAWLLVQPTAFNLSLSPGAVLNQLRFFHEENVSLSQSEIIRENSRNPLFYVKSTDNPVNPADTIITDDGLQIGLDLTGRHTQGIVALRARKNPNPIDLSKKNHYNAEEYFEPVSAQKNKITFENGDHYLIASKGELRIPIHLSAELRQYSGTGITGVFHQAGFVDPNFCGDLVFEVCFMEQGGVVLNAEDSRPASTLEFFRTIEIPDKLYGKEIGSNYQQQLGSKPSKHFKPFDFTTAAKNHQKLNRDVLVHQAKTLTSFRKSQEGFEPITKEQAKQLIAEIQNRGFFHSRYDCEDDELILQPIPYIIVYDESKRVFTYKRAENKKDYGEEKLFGKLSIGLGGHISRKDAPLYIENCLARELNEEVRITENFSKPSLIGTLMSYKQPVDRVHFGLVYSVQVKGKVMPNEVSIGWHKMCSIKKLNEMNTANKDSIETWSQILIPYLGKICSH